MRPLILASGSASRLHILRTAGFDPTVIVSDVDEAFEALDTAAIVCALAAKKANAVIARVDEGLVIGCDSLLEVDGRPFGKPRSIEEARSNWRRMRSSTATLMTGHCLIDVVSAKSAEEVVKTDIVFASPTDAELEAYLSTGESLGAAGGFTLEGFGAPFIERIEGDALNVMGISPPAIWRLARSIGVALEDLWPKDPF